MCFNESRHWPYQALRMSPLVHIVKRNPPENLSDHKFYCRRVVHTPRLAFRVKVCGFYFVHALFLLVLSTILHPVHELLACVSDHCFADCGVVLSRSPSPSRDHYGGAKSLTEAAGAVLQKFIISIPAVSPIEHRLRFSGLCLSSSSSFSSSQCFGVP